MQVMLMKSSYLIMAFAIAFYGIYSFAFQLCPKNTVKSFVAPAIILVWVILQLIFTPSWDLFSDNANRVGFLVILELCASGYLIIFQLRIAAKWKRSNRDARAKFAVYLTQKAYRDIDNADLQRQQREEMCAVILAMFHITNMPVAILDNSEVCKLLLKYFRDSNVEMLHDVCSGLSDFPRNQFDSIYANTISCLEEAAKEITTPTSMKGADQYELPG